MSTFLCRCGDLLDGRTSVRTELFPGRVYEGLELRCGAGHSFRYLELAAVPVRVRSVARSTSRLTPEQEARKAQIEAACTPPGGYKKADLARWGVPWPPPPGGWKWDLILNGFRPPL